MMKVEFEEMIGKEVSYETFRKYEEMYLALPEDVTKQQFVEMLNIDSIPESEEAIERKAKAEAFRQGIQEKIDNLKDQVKRAVDDAKRYKEYASTELLDTEIAFWKAQARNERNYANMLKQELRQYKMLMDA